MLERNKVSKDTIPEPPPRPEPEPRTDAKANITGSPSPEGNWANIQLLNSFIYPLFPKSGCTEW